MDNNIMQVVTLEVIVDQRAKVRKTLVGAYVVERCESCM